MATITPVWASQTQIMGSGGSYTTLSGTTESYSSYVDMSSSDACHLLVEVNFDTTPTDNVTISIYGSHDGTNPDDVPLFSMTIDKGVDPSQLSFVVKDLVQFRVGAKQTGATDSHDVRMYSRLRSWSST